MRWLYALPPVCSRKRSAALGSFALMLGDEAVDLRDAHPFRRVLRQPLEAAGGPEGLAFGFEAFEVQVGQ